MQSQKPEEPDLLFKLLLLSSLIKFPKPLNRKKCIWGSFLLLVSQKLQKETVFIAYYCLSNGGRVPINSENGIIL